MQLNISELVFNPKFLPYLMDRTRLHIYFGGAGSGKSYFCAQKLILTLLSKKNHGILVCRKVASTNRTSTFSLLKLIVLTWGLLNVITIKSSFMLFRCELTNSFIIFTGLDDVLKLKSINGIKTVWIEEANQISDADFKQINLRLRGTAMGTPMKDVYHIIMSLNPVNKSNWIYKKFFESEYKFPHKIMHSTYLDNNWVDEDYADQLGDKDEDENFYKVYRLGEWGVLNLQIYNRYTIKDFDIDDVLANASYIAAGMDFGFNDPTACILIAIYDNTLYILHLFYKRKITNEQLSILLLSDKYFKSYNIFADSALPQRILLLQSRSLKVSAVKKGIVKEGINRLKTLDMIIHLSCGHTIKLIEKYSWKQNKNEEYIDLPVPFDDHCMDALRYATIEYFAYKDTKPARTYGGF